jgi:hypothetical protein
MPVFKRFFGPLAFAAILITAIVLPTLPTLSQNSDSGDIACGPDVLLMWYIAGRYSGFDAVYGQMDPAAALDMSRFNRTQIGALFDARQSASDPLTGMLPGMTVNQDFVNMALATMRMDDAAFQTMLDGLRAVGSDVGAIVRTGPATVPGEAPECGHLRQTLQRFFAAVAAYDMQTGFQLSFGPAQPGVIPVPAATEDAASVPNPVATEEARSDDDDDHGGDDGSGSNSGRGGGDDNDDDNSGHGGGGDN